MLPPTKRQLIINVNAFPHAISPQAGQAYNLSALANEVDIVAIMMYDMAWWNAGVPKIARANSPLTEVSAILQNLTVPPTNMGNMDNTQYVPAAKLLPVFPWYGYDYECNTSILLTECMNTKPYCCGDGTAAKQISYSRVQDLLHQSNASKVHRGKPGNSGHVSYVQTFNSSGLSPWFDYKDDDGIRHQVWFDDIHSLLAKGMLVKDLMLRGHGCWTANADYLSKLQPSHVQQQTNLFTTMQDI